MSMYRITTNTGIACLLLLYFMVLTEVTVSINPQQNIVDDGSAVVGNDSDYSDDMDDVSKQDRQTNTRFDAL